MPFSALVKIQPRAVSYPEQSQAIREHLAHVLESEEEWTKAAQVLQGIDLDSGVWRPRPLVPTRPLLPSAACGRDRVPVMSHGLHCVQMCLLSVMVASCKLC
jgi:hypothetical protein